MAGKLKMVFQCAAVTLSLIVLSRAAVGASQPSWAVDLTQITTWIVWLAVVATIYSGAEYIVSAVRLLRSSASS
jgi:phosphatidylglycerophosphate synthase